MVMDRIEVITSVERRRRWSVAEKARLVAAMDEPGAVVTEIARSAASTRAFCIAGGDSLRRSARRRRLCRSRSTERGGVGPRRLRPPPAPAASITIAFGEQVRMTIEGAPDAATLSKVIGALTARDRSR